MEKLQKNNNCVDELKTYLKVFYLSTTLVQTLTRSWVRPNTTNTTSLVVKETHTRRDFNKS